MSTAMSDVQRVREDELARLRRADTEREAELAREREQRLLGRADSMVIPTVARGLRKHLEQSLRHGKNLFRWADLGRMAAEHLGHEPPADDGTAIRAIFQNATISNTLSGVVGAVLLEGFAEEGGDSTIPWTAVGNAPNYLLGQVYVPATGGRLTRIPRGMMASEGDLMAMGFGLTTYRLARFGKQVVVDEQDMLDGLPIAATLAAVRALGAEAARVRPDCVYSLILSNPVMPYDSLPLFDAGHANYSTESLGATSLEAAISAIGSQTLVDQEDRPVHLNLRGMVLIVPPALEVTARKLARDFALDDGRDLQVRAESRLGPAGLVDPVSEELWVGSDTNWLLATSPGVFSSVLVFGLDGNLGPVSRQFTLGQGEFGVGWDIKVDLCTVAVSHHGTYFSTGTT